MKFYSIKDLTEILSSSRVTISMLIRQGDLKAFKVGREWRVTEQSLKEFTENHLNRGD